MLDKNFGNLDIYLDSATSKQAKKENNAEGALSRIDQEYASEKQEAIDISKKEEYELVEEIEDDYRKELEKIKNENGKESKEYKKAFKKHDTIRIEKIRLGKAHYIQKNEAIVLEKTRHTHETINNNKIEGIVQEKEKIDALYKTIINEHGNKLPLDEIKKTAETHYGTFLASPMRSEFLSSNQLTITEQLEIQDIIYKQIYVAVVVNIIKDDPEMMALITQNDGALGSLQSVLDDFTVIEESIKKFIHQKEAQSGMKYGWELANDFYEKLENNKQISPSVESFMNRELDDLTLLNMPDPETMTEQQLDKFLNTMKSAINKNTTILKDKPGKISQFKDLVPEYTDYLRNIASKEVNKASLCSMIIGMQELLSSEDSNFQSLYNNDNLSLQLETFSTTDHTINFFGRDLTRSSRLDGSIQLSGTSGNQIISAPIMGIGIESVYNSLAQEQFDFDTIINLDQGGLENHFKQHYSNKTQTIIASQQQRLENNKENVHRTLEAHTFIDLVEGGLGAIDHNPTSADGRKQYYQSLIKGNEYGMIDKNVLHQANTLLASPQFVTFCNNLGTDPWEFLTDRGLVGPAATQKPSLVGAGWGELYNLVHHADHLTGPLRYNALKTFAATMHDDITHLEKYTLDNTTKGEQLITVNSK